MALCRGRRRCKHFLHGFALCVSFLRGELEEPDGLTGGGIAARTFCVTLKVKTRGHKRAREFLGNLFLNCGVTHHAEPASERLGDEKDELSLNLLRVESRRGESVTGGCLSRLSGTGQKAPRHGCTWT